MKRFGNSALAAIFCVTATQASAEMTWDMPAAYGAGNYVTQGYIAFAEAVSENSGGELSIVVHPSGSLYPGGEILRAVRSGQVPIAGRYMSAHADDDPIFGLDVVPFVATDFEQAWELYQASRPAIEAALE